MSLCSDSEALQAYFTRLWCESDRDNVSDDVFLVSLGEHKVCDVFLPVVDALLLLCSASEPSGPPELWTCQITPGASPSSWDTRPFSPASPSRPDASRPRPPAGPGWPSCSPPPTPSLCASNSSRCKHRAEITFQNVLFLQPDGREIVLVRCDKSILSKHIWIKEFLPIILLKNPWQRPPILKSK